MDTLRELVESGSVQIITSEVVIKESESQIARDVVKHVQESQSGLKRLKRQPWAGDLSAAKAIEELAGDKGMVREATRMAQQATKSLCDDLKIEMVGVGEIDGKWVIDAYFKGRPPFREPKARDDFPDAFIYRAAEQSQQKHHDIEAICADGRLAEAISELIRKPVHKGVKPFFESEIGTTLQETLRFARLWTPEKKRAVLEFLPTIETSLCEKVADLIPDMMDGATVVGDCIPEDNNEAIVSYIDEVTGVEFDWHNCEEIGPGWVEVPIEVSASAEVVVRIFRADAYDTPNWVSVDLGDPEKDHYFDAGGSLDLRIKTFLVIRFSEHELSDDALTTPASLELSAIEEVDVRDPDEPPSDGIEPDYLFELDDPSF
jgi:hypothetical protein